MVYAVAMTTIHNFERALGRRILWSQAGAEQNYQFVPRLRIYPHAMREANAYYSPKKKALLFGYFPASTSDPGHNLPGGTVFTCLSHDIIAHETTHALLDGLHRRFMEPTNADTLAFHEAFADIVALFQHFSFAPALRDQIRRTRGDLAGQNLLGQLAQQFGQALGNRGALRDALGKVDPATGEWVPRKPDPADLQEAKEPHARGAILVAAVFDAFLTIYKSRIADLLRIATAGTGVLPAGDLHPDLVDRLAREAAASAGHMLNMCIRALDYCPPVDVNFGDYLRALVTADRDLVPDDDRGYRIAVIEAFRRRGIYPQGVRSLSAESLCWARPVGDEAAALHNLLPGAKGLRRVRPDWSLSTDRHKVWEQMQQSCREIHDWLLSEEVRELAAHFGLALGPDAPLVDRPRQGRPAAVRGALGAPGAAPGAGRPDAHRPGHRDHPEAARVREPDLAGEGRQGGDRLVAAARLLAARRLHGAGRSRPRRGALLHRQGDPERGPARHPARLRADERLAAGDLLRRPPAAGAGRALRPASRSARDRGGDL